MLSRLGHRNAVADYLRGYLSKPADDAPRLPRSEIPTSLVCPFEGCRSIPFKRLSGYVGHMSGKHDVLYVKQPLAPGMKRFKEYVAAYEPTLRPWQRMAIAKHVLYGYTFVEAAEQMGRQAEALQKAMRSEAGLKYAQQISEQTEPKMMVQNMIESDIFAKYLDWQQSWVWAMENRDYDAIHRMAKDIALKPVTGDDRAQMPTSVTINLNANDIDAKPVLTSYEIIDEENEDGGDEY